MTEKAEEILERLPLSSLFEEYPGVRDLCYSLRLEGLDRRLSLIDALEGMSERYFEDLETTRINFIVQAEELIEQQHAAKTSLRIDVQSLRILGGHAKDGTPEDLDITLKPGDVVSIVGATGAGKSRFLEDIECLAQKDTPTGRAIEINGQLPGEEQRSSMERKLVAQLSQNMNFMMDMNVEEFLYDHAESRYISRPGPVVDAVYRCANDLAGEGFSLKTAVTQLSGGQSRALMIADVAILSDSPVILIDEIENAGINRQKAISVLARKGKIVLISTHDPLIALSAERRLVIRNGAVTDVIERNRTEEKNLADLEHLEGRLQEVRDRLRSGEMIDMDLKDFLRA